MLDFGIKFPLKWIYLRFNTQCFNNWQIYSWIREILVVYYNWLKPLYISRVMTLATWVDVLFTSSPKTTTPHFLKERYAYHMLTNRSHQVIEVKGLTWRIWLAKENSLSQQSPWWFFSVSICHWLRLHETKLVVLCNNIIMSK